MPDGVESVASAASGTVSLENAFSGSHALFLASAFLGHEESYNPPPEYLFTEEEEMAWKDKEKEDRRINFIPKQHECMRKVNPYDK